MNIPDNFFDTDEVMAIAGEFGPMGELVVIRLMCEMRRHGSYFRAWTPKEQRAFLAKVPGLDLDTLVRIVERMAEYNMISRRELKAGAVTCAQAQTDHVKRIGRARAARVTQWPHLVVNLLELGVVRACESPLREEPFDVPLVISPDERRWKKVRIRARGMPHDGWHVYRRVPFTLQR